MRTFSWNPSCAARRWGAALAVVALVCPLASWGQERLSRADGARMRDKVVTIYHLAAAPPATGEKRVIKVTENEINAYLAFEAGSDIPVGLADPRLTLMERRRVAGRAIVDLDAVRLHRRSGRWLDPVNYLTGRLPVTCQGMLTTRDGFAWFTLETATIAGIGVPKMVLQEVVSYYSRSPQKPQGLNLDDPFPLPARIRQIDVRRGEADVVQ